jgi:hypothetical protein
VKHEMIPIPILVGKKIKKEKEVQTGDAIRTHQRLRNSEIYKLESKL